MLARLEVVDEADKIKASTVAACRRQQYCYEQMYEEEQLYAQEQLYASPTPRRPLPIALARPSELVGELSSGVSCRQTHHIPPRPGLELAQQFDNAQHPRLVSEHLSSINISTEQHALDVRI